MIIKKNNMTYDSQDRRCQLIIAGTRATDGANSRLGGLDIAFITVIDDNTQCLRRYFGVFRWETEEESIRNIMEVGGKWPLPFRDIAIPEDCVISQAC